MQGDATPYIIPHEQIPGWVRPGIISFKSTKIDTKLTYFGTSEENYAAFAKGILVYMNC